MLQPKFRVRDNFIIGFISGLFFPLIGLVIYMDIEFPEATLLGYINDMIERELIGKLISICVIANLACTYFFNFFKFTKAMRGIVFITIIYAVVSFILLFI